MATTIDSLRNLGLKVNGSEPTSNYVNNIINEIADEYTGGGSSSSGVTSIGGADGAITLGTGLSITGQQLSATASGGTQLYKHTFTSSFEVEDSPISCTFELISLNNTAITNDTNAKTVINSTIKANCTFDMGDGDETYQAIGLQITENLNMYFSLVLSAGDGLMHGLSGTIGTDTVTTL